MSSESSKTTSSYSMWQFARDIARRIRPYKGAFSTAFLLRLSSDIANLYPAWALSEVVRLLTQASSLEEVKQRVIWLVGGWFIVWVYFSLAHDTAKWFGYRVAEKMALDVRLEALRHILTLDISWQEKENTGNKLKRIDHGSDAINKVIRIFFDVIIEASLNSVGMFVIFMTIDRGLGLSLLVFMVCYFALSSALTKKASAQSYAVNVLEEELQGLSFESLNNIKTVKALSIHEAILQSFVRDIEKTYQAISKRVKLFRVRSGALNMFYLLFRVGLTAYIVSGIFAGNFSVALLILVNGYIHKVQEAVGELAEVSHELVIDKIQFHRLKEILKIKSTIDAVPDQQLDMPPNWKKIVFKDIHFSYENKSVLKNFNLTIHRGEKVGIVGLSGAGKSTLFALLLDLYENYEGEILIDDVPLKKIGRQNYINHLAVVLQDTELFNLSLKDNIVVGGQPDKPENLEQLEEAINTAYMSEVIGRLANGMDTVIGEKGVKLSGGEKQRLGIARALYRQPDLLLMDEATSHLDVESEKKIQASLHEFFNKVTAVIIAHRLSTIKEMDRIIVMQGGQIVESGTFDQLLKTKGVFSELWEKQRL